MIDRLLNMNLTFPLMFTDTAELVEFYYLWKKTPGASNNRPRNRRQVALRRPNKGGAGGPGVKVK